MQAKQARWGFLILVSDGIVFRQKGSCDVHGREPLAVLVGVWPLGMGPFVRKSKADSVSLT